MSADLTLFVSSQPEIFTLEISKKKKKKKKLVAELRRAGVK